jgi:hypothetical protein
MASSLSRTGGVRRTTVDGIERSSTVDEPDDCPPWWPSLVWWLIRHPPHVNGDRPINQAGLFLGTPTGSRQSSRTEPRTPLFEATEELLIGLQNLYLSQTAEISVRPAAWESALSQMYKGLERLHGAGVPAEATDGGEAATRR